MEWKEFLLLLHLATSKHCKETEPRNYQACYEYIHECVLDGERFSWCIESRKSEAN